MASACDALEQHMQTFEEVCNQAGVKITPQRMEIYRELVCTEKHPDADTLCTRIRKRMPHVSLDTIYRTLSLSEEIGLIQKVDILCDRARFDANVDLHHHFVCRECGIARDF